MLLRWLLAARHRLRDLGILVLIAQQVWHSLPEFAAVSAALLLLWATMLATATSTHSKAVNTEQRLNNYVTGTDQRIITLEAGTHINVQGHTVTMTAASDAILHAQALANLDTTSNTAFLATLSQCGPQPDAGGDDPNTGSSWASGERGYVNNAINCANAIRNSLINHGFMHP
jgi:hypothetical protein